MPLEALLVPTHSLTPTPKPTPTPFFYRPCPEDSVPKRTDSEAAAVWVPGLTECLLLLTLVAQMLETQGVWETSATLGSPLTTAGLPEATQKHLSILRLAYSRLATSNVGRREKVCVFMRLVGVPWEGLGMESEYPICYSSSRSHAAFPFSSKAACPFLSFESFPKNNSSPVLSPNHAALH